MSIPGYDLEDLDDKLIELMEQRDPEELLTTEELRRYERGDSLLDLLDGEEIDALIRQTERTEAGNQRRS
jgi:hypothetical protein